MGEIEDSAAGIKLAKAAALRRAEGNDAELLRLINAASPGELAYAVAYSSGMLLETFMVLADGDSQRALVLLQGACQKDEDTFDIQARLLLEGDDD